MESEIKDYMSEDRRRKIDIIIWWREGIRSEIEVEIKYKAAKTGKQTIKIISIDILYIFMNFSSFKAVESKTRTINSFQLFDCHRQFLSCIRSGHVLCL